MAQNTQYSDSQTKNQTLAYKQRLNGWAIARLLPNQQRVIVARFRSRSDADGHLQRLRSLSPDANLIVVFDCQQDEVLN